jgi:hypothetical protein
MESLSDHLTECPSNRRYEPRKVFTVTMQYMLSEVSDNDLLECERGTGLTTNLSSGGVGFLTDQEFTEGQNLTVFNDKISSDPICAEVRWCARHSKDLFKIGLAFH